MGRRCWGETASLPCTWTLHGECGHLGESHGFRAISKLTVHCRATLSRASLQLWLQGHNNINFLKHQTAHSVVLHFSLWPLLGQEHREERATTTVNLPILEPLSLSFRRSMRGQILSVVCEITV